MADKDAPNGLYNNEYQSCRVSVPIATFTLHVIDSIQGLGTHGSRARCGSLDGCIGFADKSLIMRKNVWLDFFVPARIGDWHRRLDSKSGYHILLSKITADVRMCKKIHTTACLESRK
ncbi:hypothetical protein PoB_000283900 [Plakobranchus ocellatus]|uniref:Uncharacterized protein n=1 Tax=Plakobranchus ocellatus TaxID=259542 RepID=A0AAV3Y063_9GAST|nr:hypothetical protein PoB_000283900 [Plakobranchus ocellatus]